MDNIEENDNIVVAFVYCDGSAGPTNPGPTGYGVHITIADSKTKPKNVLGKYKLTPDGYKTTVDFKLRDDKTLLGLLHCVELYGYTDDTSTTNNTAELDAVIESISKIKHIEKTIDMKIDKLDFKCDSTYVLNAANKILNNEMDLENVVANADRIKKLSESIHSIKNDYVVSFKKVNAHTDDLGNNRADMLANMGRMLRKKPNRANFNIYIGDSDFWKDPVVDADLYHFKQLFSFYPDVVTADRSYYGLNYKKESEIGKKMSYVSYTILKTKETNKVIFDTIKTIRDVLGESYVPYIIRLKELLNKNILRDYLRYKDDYLILSNNKYLTIKTIQGEEVARELYPAGLSNIVQDKFLDYEKELHEYFKDDKVLPIDYIDITDMLYTKDAKGKNILKKDIKNDKFIIKTSYEKTKINLVMKYDLPPRNTLRRLESKDPKAILMVTDKGGMIEYKILILLNNDDVILTVNAYSNKLIKKKTKK